MLRTRVIPCLQLIDESLVKTVKFDNHGYIGDPKNTVRIFNELEVDELCFLDIRATVQKRKPNFKILSEIANECFMPLAYGGGIKDAETALKILNIGFEKVVINTAAYEKPDLIKQISEEAGSQSVIVSIDVKKNWLGKYFVYTNDGRNKIKIDPVEYAQEAEQKGAGEILLTSMNNEGTWEGFDLEIIEKVSNEVNIPVIALGGAGNISHIAEAVNEAGASAVGLGSMVVYQQQGMGVLVTFPDKKEIENHLNINK